MGKSPIGQYRRTVEKELLLGNATEHTHRPALKTLIESLEPGVVATNEPKRVACGAPDFVITRGRTPLGYIEVKDVGKPLDAVEREEQMARYLDGLPNLVLSDYLEFRWYVGGEARLTARLGHHDRTGKLRSDRESGERVTKLLECFLRAEIPTVGSPKELAGRMASLAQLIRHAISEALTRGEDGRTLHDQLAGFRKVLLHDLTDDQFADMYAQTICYGLFAARCNRTPGHTFTREHAAYDLPKTNPFLRKMFTHIAGPDLDERITWIVEDLVELLRRADIGGILEHFGRRTRREDPVVHFYETFLAAYDPRMREIRGVYYTPEPVVSYIVRSVDHILKTDFGLKEGLADASKVNITGPGGKGETKVHKVLILDPGCGTGTFLYAVIDHIYDSFRRTRGMWPGYVSEHLLPRLFGFELLMAPYAVAHMKLGMQLAETGYDFRTDERLRIYLTNTLEEVFELRGLPLFAEWLVAEASEAARVKQDKPVMVILGNPPYSGVSANMSPAIAKMIDPYKIVDGKPLDERKHWLQDDYVKFIRFAQARIEQTGYGVLAFVTNHGYLDNPTFRGMRQSLMRTFDKIYVVDLRGNARKKEVAPDGSKDENVFDIQQGVAICLMVRLPDEERAT